MKYLVASVKNVEIFLIYCNIITQISTLAFSQ